MIPQEKVGEKGVTAVSNAHDNPPSLFLFVPLKSRNTSLASNSIAKIDKICKRKNRSSKLQD